MKKILFMVIDMNIGGTEKALLTMLSELSRERYHITVLMMREQGGFLKYIPNEVNVKILDINKDIEMAINEAPINVVRNYIRKRKILKASGILYYYFISKITKRRDIYYKYILKEMESEDNEYDVAIAYAGPMEFISYYVCNKIKAKRKLQWIHFDINKIGFDKFFAKRLYKKFDKIFCVSTEGRDKLIEKIPCLRNKVEVFLNIISENLILKQINLGKTFNDSFTGVRLLTVGRLCNQKGQDIAIKVMNKLIKDGLDVRWYCIGDGSNRNEYEKLIREFKMEEKFILLGATDNPYRYMYDCDIYIQPSRHEGYCTTVTEAKILKKPMIITDVNGSREQIKNGYNGIIVDFDEEQIYKAIKNLIKNIELREKFRESLEKEKISTNEQIKKLIEIIDN